MLGIGRLFGKDAQFALHGISYQNALLYSKAMPMPGDGDQDGEGPAFDESKDANNPDNFKNFTEDEEIVKA